MARSDRVGQILVELLRPTADDDALPARLVRLGRERLQVTGLGLAWMSEDGPGGTLAATDGPAEVLEELQYSLGAGPGVEASQRGYPIMQEDLARVDPGRWPGFAEGAEEVGIAAAFAFPLQVGGIKLGAVDLYQDATGPLAEAVVEEARALAGAATAVLLHLQSSAGRGDVHDDLADTVLDRSEVHQATGMVSVQIGSSLSDAFAVLRGRAFATGRRISDVAHAVITREMRFNGDDL